MSIKPKQKYDKLTYFEFQTIFFSDKVKYSKIPNNIKESFAFQLFRTLAIKYPKIINKFQGNSHYSVIDFLHNRYYLGYKPDWVYQSSKKGVVSDLLAKYDDNVIEYAMLVIDYEYKSMVLYSKRNPIDCEKLLKECKVLLENKVKKTKK